ncbi:MAG: glycosyltransferase family 4 protein, partial [Aggregatilineales bacterium]
MNILIISRCPPYPPQFGDRLILWHLARELKKRGHTLDIVAFSQFDTDADDAPHYDAYFRKIDLIPETPRSPIAYLKRAFLSGTRFPKNASQAWSPEMWQMIEKHLSEQTYDVVHVFGGVQVYEFHHLIAHLPNIIVPYESYSLYLKRLITQENTLKHQLMQRMSAHFEHWMFAPYGKTVVLADPDKDELTRLNPVLDVAIIPNGIDLDFFQPVDRDRPPATLLFVGNYDYAPNIDAALLLATQIFPTVKAQIPAAKLILAGKAPPENIKALANEHIQVTGWVDDIREVYAQATIFVCPLRIGAGMKN